MVEKKNYQYPKYFHTNFLEENNDMHVDLISITVSGLDIAMSDTLWANIRHILKQSFCMA